MYRVRKLFQPEIFQGKYKRKHYFEGWYYKLIDPELKNAVVIIPGISIGKDRQDSHAFIQVLYQGSQVAYYRFEPKEFRYHPKRFAIRIEDNYFTEDRIRLKLNGEGLMITGSLTFHNLIKLPKTLYMPGIMGPYSYLPIMECYHGIVNIHHEITGEVAIAGKTIDFTGGYGYIEKDWGRSFPKTWIWLQSNHFGEKDVTVMFSAARIPWLGSSFPGFISFLRLGGKLYVFASYTSARLLKLDHRGDQVSVIVEDRRYRLELQVWNREGGQLMAPVNGRMAREILESINATVHVRLLTKTGRVIFAGRGTSAGLEIV
jgi:hypothetical protein